MSTRKKMSESRGAKAVLGLLVTVLLALFAAGSLAPRQAFAGDSNPDQKTSITVDNTWVDDYPELGGPTFPSSVTVRLFNNDKEVDSVVLSAENDWKHTFTPAAYDEGGEPVIYRVVAEEVIGYFASYTYIDDATSTVVGEGTAGPLTCHITNTRIHTGDGVGSAGGEVVPLFFTINMSKEWDDAGHEADRPETVTFRLFLFDKYEVEAITLSAENDWKGSFKPVSVWEMNPDRPDATEGMYAKYTVLEDENPNYEATFKNSVETVDGGNVLYMNKLDPDISGILSCDITATNSFVNKEPEPAPEPDPEPEPEPEPEVPKVEAPKPSPAPEPEKSVTASPKAPLVQTGDPIVFVAITVIAVSAIGFVCLRAMRKR